MSNNWWKIQILCDPSLEELVFWRLEKFGCPGTATEVKGKQHWITAYIPVKLASLGNLAALELSLKEDAMAFGVDLLSVTKWQEIQQEDWGSNWKKHWSITEIGDRFLICPAWLSPPPHTSRLVLRLDPGIAFGTGTHPTTSLCLEALEMRFAVEKNQIIADIGCGSGILSIAASLLGAPQVYGVDIDPLAIYATKNNRNLNQIDAQKLTVARGSVEELMKLKSDGFNGIMCNILAETIIELIPQMTNLAKPTTWAILSGILLEQTAEVTHVVEEYGWIVATIWEREKWCCLNIRRS